MKKLTAQDPETKSTDMVAENIEHLKAHFPEAVSEGKIDFDVLRQLVGDAVDEREEKYGLNWHGKRKARRLALTPSTGTLRPCSQDSVDWETTKNLMIEGDNLEVLKLLQKSYAGKVKLIYIDPPYNTGKDFVYPDNFQDNIRNYLELTGQIDDGRKISTNSEASGRFHTDWLNMMYPRLKLARNLLREDGVVFISIDDNEVHGLRCVMDDVFGEENFVATVIWQKVYSPKPSARLFSDDHDYIVVYARDAVVWQPELLPRTEEMEERYSNPDNDPRGPWKPGDLSARNYYSAGTYAIKTPSGRLIDAPPQGNYWRVSKAKFDEMDRDGRIWWGKDGSNVPAIKRFLSEVKAGAVPQTLWKYQDVGHTQEAKKELIERVAFSSSDSVFETPKPTRLIERMLRLSTKASENDIVLDFFAGTGSAGDAVLKLNGSDHGNRRFILVQFPEPTVDSRLKTIAEITKERLRIAGKRIREDTPMFAGDLGFRVFKLASSNIQAWEPDRENLAQTLEEHAQHLRQDRTEADILFELLLKLGLDLNVPIEEKTIAGKTVHSIGAGTLIACLADTITAKQIEPLGQGIAEWHKAQNPSGECTVVFRDSAFADDVAKTNLTAILQQHGLENVRSL